MKWLLLVAVVALFGYGAWRTDILADGWHRFEMTRAASEWKRLPERADEEKQVQALLTRLADALDAGDVQTALACYHSDSQAEVAVLMAEHPERLSPLAQALREAKIVYLSPPDDTKEYLYAARCQAQFGEEASEVFTVTLVKLETGWVVEP